MKRRAFAASSKRQHGAVLFVSLIILVVLTLLAVTTANTALLENRMASAARNRQLAEFAAGSAISEARQRILAIASASGAAAVCAQLRCLVREPGWPERAAELVEVPAVRTAMNGLPVDFTKFDGVDASARLAAAPGFLVEDLGTQRSPPPAAGPRRAFRITAVGTGATAEAASVIEVVQDVQE